ncbi:phage tail tape measure protein, partial [Rosistilla oblonga]|uniref:phage tail tape measure protein n=1 Tax=Rosistilla oblonga TaxID=2527990 RepID=UPI003A97F510
KAKTPEAVAASKALADEIRRGEQITQQFLTAEQKHEAQARELKAMLDNETISQEAYSRALRASEKTLPAVIEAEARRNRELAEAAQIMQRAESAEERYSRETQQLKRHLDAGRISQEAYNRELQEATSRLPKVQAAERERAQSMQRGEQITQQFLTAEQKHEAQVRELKGLVDAGRISQETYTRALQASEQTLPAVIEAEARRNRELAEAAQIMQRAESVEERYSRETQQLKRHLDAGRISQEAYNRELQEATSRLPRVQAAERERAQSMQRAEQWTRSLENATEKYTRQIHELDQALRKGEISQELHSRGVRRAADEQQRASRRPSRGIGMVGRIGANAGGALLAEGVGAVGQLFRGVVQRNEEFQQAMHSSLAIAGDVPEAMRANLTRASQQIAYHTKFSATEAASSIQYLQLAGYSLEKSLATMPAVARFAQAGMFDIATATDLATDAQASLGLNAESTTQHLTNMTRVTDVLARGSAIANASIEQFSLAITSGAGPAARLIGMEVEETTAILASFASTGFAKGEEAGTQFGIVVRDLTTKAIENREAFAAAGIQVFDSAGNFNKMADIVGQLETKLGSLSDEEQKASLLGLGFSDKSSKSLTALLGQSEAMRTYEEQLIAAGGTTQDVAERQMPPLTAALQKMEAAWDLFTEIVANPIIVDAAGATGELGFIGEAIALVADTVGLMQMAWDAVGLSIDQKVVSVRMLVKAMSEAAEFLGMDTSSLDAFNAETDQRMLDNIKKSQAFVDKHILGQSPGEKFRAALLQIQQDMAKPPEVAEAKEFVGPEMSEQMKAQRRIAKEEADAAREAREKLEKEKKEAAEKDLKARITEAEQLTASMMTAEEKRLQEMQKLDAMRARPIEQGGITDETYRRRKEQLDKEARRSKSDTKQGAPSTAGRGTAEAYKMIVDAMRAQAADKPEDKIVAATEKGNSELEKLNGKIEQLGDVFGSVG